MKPIYFLPLALAASLTSAARADNMGDTLFRRGTDALDRGDYEEARRAFVAASVYLKTPSVWRDLGLAEMKLGRPVDALHHFRAASAAPGASTLSPAKVATLKANIDAAFAATGHIVVDAPAGAVVTVDGQARDGVTPFRDPVDVMPGPHEVAISQDGKVEASWTVSAPPGELTHARLEPKGDTLSGAKVLVSPASPAGLAPQAAPAPVAQQPDGPAASPTPGYWSEPIHVVGLVVGGLGVASVATGIAFDVDGFSARSSASQILSARPPSQCAGPAAPAICNAAADDLGRQH